jgi:hypothetical protein
MSLNSVILQLTSLPKCNAHGKKQLSNVNNMFLVLKLFPTYVTKFQLNEYMNFIQFLFIQFFISFNSFHFY